MSPQYTYLLYYAAGIFVVLLLWASSIAIVYWDTHRRNMRSLEGTLWLILAVILPFVGFLAYWVARIVARFLAPVDDLKSEPKRRVTQAMRVEDLGLPPIDNRKGTIPSTQILQEMGPVIEPAPGLPPLQVPAQPQATIGFVLPGLGFVLEVEQGPCAGQEFQIDSLPISIGRGPYVAVRLDQDLNVSRQHAEVYDHQGVLRIRDLKSLHGTQVNGFSVEDKGLELGDKITIGNSVLVLKKAR